MRVHPWLLCALPLFGFAGCLLPSYDNIAGSPHADGGEATGGAGGLGAGGVGAAMDGGAPVGGEASGGAPSAPELLPDRYLIQQGQTLSVAAKDGVLANDSGALTVTGVDDADVARDPALDADLEITADGALSFSPAADFFGRYVASYTVEDAAGHTATSSVTFVVQPVESSLATIEQGAGGVVIEGGSGDGAGASLAALGDVNDDGFDDFAIGAPDSGAGAVYVVFGRADLAGFALGEASASETRFASLLGTADSPIGSSVASAGDFDAGMVPDIVIGSPGADAEAGRVFVVRGGSGLKGELALDASTDVERAISFLGESSERLGTRVAGPLDYNGDEQADLALGIFPGGSTRGGVTVTLENPTESGPLASALHSTMEDASVYNLPESLAAVGDVNADGYGDVLASSRRHVVLLFGQADGSVPASVNTVQAEGIVLQRADNVTGTAVVAAAGDVNGDGREDAAYCDVPAVGAAPVCRIFFNLLGSTDSLASGDWLLTGFAQGGAALLAAGRDLNEDGLADLVSADENGVYVVFGRKKGFGDVKVSSLGSDGFSLAVGDAQTIATIATIGDVNGDGYGDFALGDVDAGSGAGRVYVVFGGPFSAEQR